MLQHTFEKCLEWLILSFGWVLREKNVLGWERHGGGNEKVLKNCQHLSFKICKNTFFAGKLLVKIATEAHISFAGRVYSQASHESFYMKFNVFQKFAILIFAGRANLWASRENALERVFLLKTRNKHFGQKL